MFAVVAMNRTRLGKFAALPKMLQKEVEKEKERDKREKGKKERKEA